MDANINYNEQNQNLLSRYFNGEVSIRNEIIENNLPLVGMIASKYAKSKGDYEDLFQTGVIGLIDAINNYDPKKGCKFSTLAVPCITNKIKRYVLKNESELYIAERMQGRVILYDTLRSKNYSEETIMKIMKMEESEFIKFKELYNKAKVKVISANSKVLSNSDNEHNNTEVIDLIKSDNETEESAIENVFRSELVEEMSKILSERQLFVVCMRFGLLGDKIPMDVSEISEIMGVTEKRIYQILNRSLAKLKNSESIKQYKMHI